MNEVKDLLMLSFSRIYCDTCGMLETDKCDYCHRKSMNWSISEEYADILVKKIASLNAKVEILV